MAVTELSEYARRLGLPSVLVNAGRKFMPIAREQAARHGVTVEFSKPARRIVRRLARLMNRKIDRALLELWDEMRRLRS